MCEFSMSVQRKKGFLLIIRCILYANFAYTEK